MAEGGTQAAATGAGDRAVLGCALLAALLLLTAASVRCIWGHDFWWQWRTGEIIATEGLPSVDTLSYTRQGFRWIEMHWLYCLGLYHLFNTFGPAAPVALQWLTLVATFAFSAAASVDRSHVGAALLVLPVAILTSSQRFFVRPELVTLLMLATFVWVLQRWRRRGGNGIYALPLLQVLWTNSHTLFLMGPFVVGLLLVVEVAERGLVSRPDRVALRPLAVVFVLTTVSCLLNPYGIRGVAFPFELWEQMRSPVFKTYISEFHGPFSFAEPFVAVRWFVVLIGLCLLSVLGNRRRVDPFLGLLCLSQLGFALLAIRNLPLFALTAVPLVVDNLGARWRGGVGRVERALERVALIVGCGVSLIYGWQLATDRFNVWQNDTNQFGLGVATNRYPTLAVSFMKAHDLHGPIFNTLLEGSYLTAEHVPVFIDPRNDIYGDAYFERFIRIQREPTAWRTAAREFGFTQALVDLASPLVTTLAHDQGWRLVFVDPTSALFVRDDLPGAPPALQTTADFLGLLAVLGPALPSPPAYETLGVFDRVASPLPYWRLGMFLEARGQAQLAGHFYQEALRAYPEAPGLAYTYARSLQRRGATSEALRYYRNAARSTPDNAHVHLDFAQLALQVGQTAQALAEFREVARCEPSAETWSRIARLQTQLGNPAEAADACRRAGALDPTVPCVAGR